MQATEEEIEKMAREIAYVVMDNWGDTSQVFWSSVPDDMKRNFRRVAQKTLADFIANRES
jgi:hypothetical protein